MRHGCICLSHELWKSLIGHTRSGVLHSLSCYTGLCRALTLFRPFHGSFHRYALLGTNWVLSRSTYVYREYGPKGIGEKATLRRNSAREDPPKNTSP